MLKALKKGSSEGTPLIEGDFLKIAKKKSFPTRKPVISNRKY